MSDTSLTELHDFAERVRLPRRLFDEDHYDVPAERYDEVVAHAVTADQLRDEFAEIDTRELFEVALADGVAFIPGPALSPGGRFRNSMRLCFASSTPERIDEGVRRLTASLEKMAG